jgi:response regulator RpfG family c-di-GMP phosphodiesterase
VRILLAEDNAEHRKLMSLALTSHNLAWQVEEVTSGDEALRYLAEGESYDLVLLDYSLPGRDGLEVLREIRRSEAPPPVVMVTGRGDEQMAVEAMNAGAYDYVVKSDGYLLRLPVVAQQALAESVGARPDSLVGCRCCDIWAGRSEPGEGCPIVKAMETGKPQEAEITTRDGTVWFIRGNPVKDEDDKVMGAVEVTLEITERKGAGEEIRRHLQRIGALREIDRAITDGLGLRGIFSVILKQVITQLGVDAVDVLLLNPDTQILEYSAGRGFRTNALQHTYLKLGEGHAGRAVLERNVISIANLAEAENGLKRSLLLPDEGFIAYYGVPLIAKGQVKGVLEIFHRAPLDPAPEWLDFLETLAGQVAVAIDNVTLFDDLQRSNAELSLAYDTTLEGWAKALELHDAETEGHSRSVTEMTVRMAQAAGMSDAELVHVRRGALLHDIGKMGIPDSILQKPGPLTDEEWEIVHQHPVYAYELLSPIVHLRPALDIPYCHHEKWDGSGYPRGIAGEEIPLAARIFAVVDVWDALTSERPYRPAWTEEKAVEYIRDQAGKHFDPKVVEMFLKLEMGMTEQANELEKE